MPSLVPATVLIAEDSTLLRELMGGVVHSLPGYRLLADSADCASTLAACRAHQPDLVILGWHFADGTGGTVLKELVAGLPRTRWLVLCGRPSGKIVHSAITLGAHGFVLKQAGVGALREAIARLAEGGTYYCPASSRLLLEALRPVPVSSPDRLTEREREVLRHFAAGSNPKHIGALLNTSAKTVQNQLGQIRQKLGVHGAAGLVRYALHADLD